MALCKAKQIQNCCLPNALMTLKEYLEDYASEDTKTVGMDLIEKYISGVTNPKAKEILRERLTLIEQGERDFRF